MREDGFVGGGITAWFGSNSGVVNILSPRGEPAFPPPRGLFVMASRTALHGGVLARCAMMALVLDLAMAGGPGASPVVLRVFARELAVGANSLDVVLVGLKMEALLLLVVLLPLLLLVPSAAIPANSSQGTRAVDVDEREAPTLFFMPALTEKARTL